MVNEGVRRLSLVVGLLGLVLWAAVAGTVVYFSLADWRRAATAAIGDREEVRILIKQLDSLRTVAAEADTNPVIVRITSGGTTKWPSQRQRALFDINNLEMKLTSTVNSGSLDKQNSTFNRMLVLASLFVVGLPLCYLLPWGFVRVVAWVIVGFRHPPPPEP